MSFVNTHTPTKPSCKARWQVPQRRHPQAGVMEYYMEGEIKDKFCELFPKHSNIRIMKWFGISFSTLQRFKRDLGLSKDMKAIHKEHGMDVKKKLEKNGYYDSIRGKAPSQAAIEATKKSRAESPHPWVKLRETNPRKYKIAMKKKCDKWMENREKDKRRVLFGLEQKTRFRHTFTPLSHQAISHKWAMIRHCNYFSVDDHPSWVCYDRETKRSQRREETAKRHGLRVVEAED